jgi:4-hydroxy-tetrahydrodipicolinate synthase
VTIGVSGDASAAAGLSAGCEAWYSVIGGLFPQTALAITRAAQAGNISAAAELSNRLQPLWDLFTQYGGSLRVMATACELLGLATGPSLPLPLQTLEGPDRAHLASLMETLTLD